MRKDLRHEIPARAFINQLILQEALPSPDFQRAVQSVLDMPLYKNQGLVEYDFDNQAQVVSLLYCLIVVPKELWAKPSGSAVYTEIEDRCPAGLFQILKNDGRKRGSLTYQLIHRLRNAVAHANYSVDADMTFTFWDMPPGQMETEWESSANLRDLMTFLSIVGGIMASAGVRGR